MLQSFETSLKFPIAQVDGYLVGGGACYKTLWISGIPAMNSYHLHGISSSLFASKKLKNDRMVVAFASAGIYSDLEDISGKDFRYNMGFSVKTVLHDDFELWYGLAYSKKFFGSVIVPYLDFKWQINEKWQLAGPFPINTKLSYQRSEKSKILTFMRPNNSSYRLSEELESRYLRSKEWNLGLAYEYKLTPHWVANLHGGRSLKRIFEVYEAGYDNTFNIITVDVSGKDKPEPVYSFDASNWFLELKIGFELKE